MTIGFPITKQYTYTFLNFKALETNMCIVSHMDEAHTTIVYKYNQEKIW